MPLPKPHWRWQWTAFLFQRLAASRCWSIDRQLWRGSSSRRLGCERVLVCLVVCFSCYLRFPAAVATRPRLVAVVAAAEAEGEENCAANSFCMALATFFPTTLTVQVGTPVTWTNGSSQTHDVIFTAAPVADIPAHSSGSNVRTFNVAGSYDFHCEFHPGMVGTLTVTP